MIQDKDYIIRIVKQFSEFMAKMITGGNGDGNSDWQRVFDTNMNDTFKMTFDELANKSTEEIHALIAQKDTAHHIPYYELLGHLFYFKFKEEENKVYAEKSHDFYQTYLQKSGVFSLPVVNRMNELKTAL